MEEIIRGSMLELSEKMADLTCELAQTCNEKENYFASTFNLTPAEFKCLRLFTKKDSQSIKIISNLMKLTPGRITHILTSLEEKHLIVRELDPMDRRNVIVSLTAQSKPFIKNLSENHIKLHAEILEKIDPDKREFIVDAMNDVIRALKKWSDSLN
jgi:DNA-binding MarR family transcriptional regulator